MFGVTNYRLFNNERDLLSDIFSDWNKFEIDVLNKTSFTDLLHRTEDGNYEFRINLAGYKKDEVDVSLEDHVLTVIAENKKFGKKSYSATISKDLDSDLVKSKLEDGILYIIFKKLDKFPKKKTIKVY